jgi:hypothetical protein
VLLLGSAPFANFIAFSDWLYATTHATHQIAIERLFDAIHLWLSNQTVFTTEQTQELEAALLNDYRATGAKGRLKFMDKGISVASNTLATKTQATPPRQSRALAAQVRQLP